MRYPIAIEIGSKTAAYGVVVADLPGRFSAGDTIDEAVTAAEEAAAAWIDATLDTGGPSPPRPVSRRCVIGPNLPVGRSGSSPWNPAALDSTIERVNITLPRRVLLRLDAQARAAGATRSGFIARLTLEERRDRQT